jgi:hypothetical protein
MLPPSSNPKVQHCIPSPLHLTSPKLRFAHRPSAAPPQPPQLTTPTYSTQTFHTPIRYSNHTQTTHNAPPFLPNRRPDGRIVRHARRLWRPRPQETHRRPRAHHELEHSGAVSGTFTPPPLPAFAIHKRRCVFEPCKFAIGVRTLKRCSPPIPTFRNPSSQAHAPAAHPLHRPDLHRHRRAAEHAGDGAFHSGHGHVQRLDILACVGPAEVQVPRAGHAVGGRVFDRRVGCVGGEGKAGLEEVKEEG